MDHLLGTVGLTEAIARDEASGAYVLSAGSRSATPADILGSEKMRDMLNVLSTQFDLIIIDSAPVLAVSDTRSLCRMADKVVMAVRWQHTRRAAVSPALRLVTASGGDVFGIVLTMADTKRLPDYSGNAYYFPQVRRYLT